MDKKNYNKKQNYYSNSIDEQTIINWEVNLLPETFQIDHCFSLKFNLNKINERFEYASEFKKEVLDVYFNDTSITKEIKNNIQLDNFNISYIIGRNGEKIDVRNPVHYNLSTLNFYFSSILESKNKIKKYNEEEIVLETNNYISKLKLVLFGNKEFNDYITI